MKRFAYTFSFLAVWFLAVFISTPLDAARPNPPSVAGTVPVILFAPEPGGTNLIAVPPRVLVLDERGRTAADVETTVVNLTGTFNIPLKKAGTYVVAAYYPEPNRLLGLPQLVEVFRKQTSLVELDWQPQ
jgi:hypothetical protein